MQIVDTHAHLDFPISSRKAGLRGTSVDDLKAVLSRAKEEGVDKIITIGTSVESSKRCIEIAEKYSSDDLKIFATCGLHPKDAKTELAKHSIDDLIGQLRLIAESSDKIVAVGECGLDYFLETSEKEKEFQRELFEAQVELAAELKLPLVVHCRNGWAEIFGLVSQRGRTSLGVFHCWTGNWRDAKRALDLGFYISFSGIVTFKNAPEIQEVAKKMPIDRMLIETDSPFLSPDPHRGETNEPKNVKIIAQFLAYLRGLPLDKIAEATTRNAESIFRIKSI